MGLCVSKALPGGVGAAGPQSTSQGLPPQHERTLALSFTVNETSHRTTCFHHSELEVTLRSECSTRSQGQ